MRLQPRGLVADQRVGRGVRLVEAVTGELVDQVEDLVGEGLLDLARARALHEAVALLAHRGLVLLAHRAAQQVGATERVAGELPRHLHHLLLVHEDAVGGLQRLGHAGMQVRDRGAAVLARDEVRDQVHRARPVQRDQRDDVLEAVGLELDRGTLHAAGFHLEHRARVARGVQRVGRLVVQRDLEDLEVRLARGLLRVQEIDRGLDDRQRLEAQEVELYEAHFLEILHVELRDQPAAARFAEQRREFGQRPRRDDHAARVHADVAREALELHAEVHHGLHVLFLLAGRLELRHLVERLAQREALGAAGNHLGDAVAHGPRVAHHARDVAHHGPRGHRAVGDDLADALAAVAVLHVVDHAVAAVHAEVDVEVRQRHALGIQEALEQQFVGQRIEVGDAGGVGHQRAGARAATRPHRNAVALAPGDEVSNHQEIAGEAHLFDHAELVVEPLAIVLLHVLRLGRVGGEARFEPPDSLLAQERRRRVAFRHRVVRQVVHAERQRQRAAPRDLDAVGQRLRQVGEQRLHLLRALQVLLGCVRLGPALVVERPALRDADARLVRRKIAAAQEAHVVGRHHRRAGGAREVHGAAQVRLVVGTAAAADLEVEPVAEYFLQRFELGLRSVEVAAEQRAADAAVRAGQHDQAGGARSQRLELHARRARALPLRVGIRHELHQVAVALLVLHQQRHAFRHVAGLALLEREVGADDRLHALAFRRLVELHHRKQVGLVGDRHRSEAELDGLLGQRLEARLEMPLLLIVLDRLGPLEPDDAVLQRVLGVEAEVNEGWGRSQFPPPACRRSRSSGKLTPTPVSCICATGAKSLRWIAQGPCSRNARRWSGVP